MKVVEFGPLTDERRSELQGDELDPFETRGITLSYRRKDRHVGIEEGGRLVGSTGMLVTRVEIGGARFPVVGIGGVIVAAAYRGQGLGQRVVEEALARAQE